MHDTLKSIAITRVPFEEETVKHRLIEEIIQNRLYKTKDIEDLVLKEKIKNPYLNDDYLRSLTQQVIAAFSV